MRRRVDAILRNVVQVDARAGIAAEIGVLDGEVLFGTALIAFCLGEGVEAVSAIPVEDAVQDRGFLDDRAEAPGPKF